MSSLHGAPRPLPPRALGISLAALAVALAGAFFFREAMVGYSFIPWLLALTPALLLALHRNWIRVMYVLGAGMVLLTAAHFATQIADVEIGEWPGFVFVLATYIGLALGLGWWGEVRSAVLARDQAQQESARADDDLRRSHAELKRSHAELKLAQWKLIEVEKFEAVGHLAAGVAHEVKNPLMVLLTGVRYLSVHMADASQDVRVLLQDMQDAVTRADAVIAGLLDFSTPHALNPTRTDLDGVVRRSINMVKHEVDRANVRVREELAPGLPRLDLDHQRIQQVLVNVLTNAAHATSEGGTITVRTYEGPAGPDDAEATAAVEGLPGGRRSVILEVDDTGSGIPDENLHRLFNPFFTTKPSGQGTGLGLAVTRQIVEMHGAIIGIRNRNEGGARVTIVLPVPEEGQDDGHEAHPAG